jgi:hypothetical protein
MNLKDKIVEIAKIDLFKEARKKESFIGRPFSVDYQTATLLVADAWKMQAGGIPQGTFLLAFYENEPVVSEGLLMRAIEPTKLPTSDDVIRSMIEYFKDDLGTTGTKNQLDDFTRYEFSFSGLLCHVLGTFYRDSAGKLHFGADVENYYSPHNYNVYKATGKVLELIVNYHDETSVSGGLDTIKIGRVRYSSSIRFQQSGDIVPVYVRAQDFLGKRTALFGMTRTGKSNTVKKIIQATYNLSQMASSKVTGKIDTTDEDYYQALDKRGLPRYPVGQIIFDINGEYANANMQDEGTAIFELYKKDVLRYCVQEKTDFKVMKVNFYNDLESGFSLIQSSLLAETGDYVQSFVAVDMSTPDPTDHSATTRFGRLRAAYFCCLHRAGFTAPKGFKLRFEGNKEINSEVKEGGLDPSKGISLDEAVMWFEWVWDNYQSDYFNEYRRKSGREWADENLQAMLIFLTRKRKPGGAANVSGYQKLRSMVKLHTDTVDEPFTKEIVRSLRDDKIIIIDLSQGDPIIQALYSERICQAVFADAMDRFVSAKPNNFVQFYFEEAHNLFPIREDKDLSQIYNRIAKEGAKLNLGLIYATQEVSSISANILKNTQNWFIAHLNNEDEVREIRKFYDFADFSASLVRFSSDSDKGFVRMKTYSNPYIVPVQIDRFLADKEK